MKRSPMPRGKGFKRPVSRHEPSVEREPKPASKLSMRPNTSGSVSGVAVQKEKPVRSQAYRRLVAALPCIHCGKPGPSQCAHSNTGKGMGLKASDAATFPLCPDCHRAFDQGAMFNKAQRRDVETLWVSQTRAQLERRA